MTQPENLTKILSRITGQEISPSTSIKLTSVQLAAFSSMSAKAGIPLDRARLLGPFTIEQLLSGDAPTASAPTEQTPSSAPATASGTDSARQIGCDIQCLEEFEALIDNPDFKECAFLTGTFSLAEISYCENQQAPVTSLCGLFAAKEAILKAGADLPFHQITISHDNGAPVCSGYSVSISHSGAYCMAVAVTSAQPTTSHDALPAHTDSATVAALSQDTTQQPDTDAPPEKPPLGSFVKLAYHGLILAAVIWLIASRF